VDTERAHQILIADALDRPETFYAAAEGRPLGAGLVVDGVEFPIFDPEMDRFRVVRGLVYVVSHECDLDPENERLLNDRALVCPITSLDALIASLEASALRDDFVGAFIGNLARRNVNRALYLPPIDPQLPKGGLLYLNEMTSTAVTRLEAGEIICTVTAFGLFSVDMALENHLRRPKAQSLPLEFATVRKGSSHVGSRPEWSHQEKK
jgi:hypothetical protein